MKTISTGKAFNELDSKELGKWGERIATQYIEKLGLTVVDTNYRTRLGEIDIIECFTCTNGLHIYLLFRCISYNNLLNCTIQSISKLSTGNTYL